MRPDETTVNKQRILGSMLTIDFYELGEELFNDDEIGSQLTLSQP